MEKFQEIVKGYKTYAIIVLMVVVSILEQQAVIETSTATTLMEYLALGGGATLVAKFNRFMSSS